MNFTYDIKHRNMIVKLSKEIDHHHAEEIRTRLDQLIDMHGIKNLIFDFSETEFMDSSGIGVIMGRYRKIKETNGGVGLIHVNEQIQKLLKLSGIYRLIKDYSNVQDAIKRLG